MYGRIDRKIMNKKSELISDCDNYVSQIEIRSQSLVQEQYTKATLSTMMEKMKSDINKIKKEITYFEFENGRVNKSYEKEKFIKTAIKEKVNQLFSKEKKMELVILTKL